MEEGITIIINGIAYYFEDGDKLIDLLDERCNDAYECRCSSEKGVYFGYGIKG